MLDIIQATISRPLWKTLTLCIKNIAQQSCHLYTFQINQHVLNCRIVLIGDQVNGSDWGAGRKVPTADNDEI